MAGLLTCTRSFRRPVAADCRLPCRAAGL